MVIIIRDRDDNVTLAEWSVDNNYPIPNVGDSLLLTERMCAGKYIPYHIKVTERVFSVGTNCVTLITDYKL